MAGKVCRVAQPEIKHAVANCGRRELGRDREEVSLATITLYVSLERTHDNAMDMQCSAKRIAQAAGQDNEAGKWCASILVDQTAEGKRRGGRAQ